MNTNSLILGRRGLVLMLVLVMALVVGSPAQGQDGWLRYQDPDFGFSIPYAVNWDFEVTLENPGRSEDVIRRQIVFTGPSRAQIHLDLWENRSGVSLEQWFIQNQQPLLSRGTGIPEAGNAIIGGIPAFVVSEPRTRYKPATVLSLWRSPEGTIFRMTYFSADSGAAESIYRQMLSGFVDSSPQLRLTSIPQLQLAYLDQSHPVGDSTCCGYSDPGNPYGCCPDVSPCCGNCVWWAHYRATWLPDVWWGEPAVWPQKAREAGFETGSTPKVGAVVAYTSGDHVAYVEEVNASTGQYRVSEMWWPDGCDHDCCHVCTDNWKTGGEFIYAPDSVCCGCLPAACCSGAAAQTGAFPTEITWFDSGGPTDGPDPSSVEGSPPAGLVSATPITITAGAAGPSGTNTPTLPAESEGTIVEDTEQPYPVTPEQLSVVSSSRLALVNLPKPSSTSYRIAKSVFGSGGGAKTSTHFVMNSTQGQSTNLSRRTSTSYVLVPGYWGIWSKHAFEQRLYLPQIVRNH